MTKRLLIAAVLTMTAAAAHAQSTAPKGDAANGKKLFQSYGCYQCHGTMGQGTSAGAHLAPKPIPWEMLSKYVRHPLGQMPPYTAKVVSDMELADIYAYLQSIPAAPAVKDLPLIK